MSALRVLGYAAKAVGQPVMAEKGHPFWKMCLDTE
jgi:hypothetical protein